MLQQNIVKKHHIQAKELKKSPNSAQADWENSIGPQFNRIGSTVHNS